MSSATRTETTDLTAEEIVAFLDTHPEFLEQHPELVAKLVIPHQAGSAVSLIEKQVEILRNQNRTLERKLIDLIEVARANDAAVERIHQLMLSLMDANDLPDLLHNMQDRLRHRFGADAVTLLMFRGDPDKVEFGPVRRVDFDSMQQEFQQVFTTGKPVVGRLRPQQLEILFGDAAGSIGSSALLPLGTRGSLGLLGIGAESEDQFGPTLGTTFLERIAELLTAALRRHVDSVQEP
ncbi:MAG: DUF484 family protein [Gammaproteobacteria bacterium]|nr:DUF484 family protein [Gammaproteobacteria bacterium]